MIKDRETRLQYYRDYQKIRRAANRKEGICIICQKEKVTQGRSTCDGCRKYYREYMKASRAHV